MDTLMEEVMVMDTVMAEERVTTHMDIIIWLLKVICPPEKHLHNL